MSLPAIRIWLVRRTSCVRSIAPVPTCWRWAFRSPSRWPTARSSSARPSEPLRPEPPHRTCSIWSHVCDRPSMRRSCSSRTRIPCSGWAWRCLAIARAPRVSTECWYSLCDRRSRRSAIDGAARDRHDLSARRRRRGRVRRLQTRPRILYGISRLGGTGTRRQRCRRAKRSQPLRSRVVAIALGLGFIAGTRQQIGRFGMRRLREPGWST